MKNMFFGWDLDAPCPTCGCRWQSLDHDGTDHDDSAIATCGSDHSWILFKTPFTKEAK